MSSVFTSIIEGNIPSYKLDENEYAIALLDIFPLREGHTLVVPKREVNHWFELPADEFAQLMSYAHQISHAIRQAIPCNRIGVVIAGFEIPHCHIHLIPVNHMNEMEFSNPKLKFSDEAFRDTAHRLSLIHI